MTSGANEKQGWDKRQVRDFVRDVRKSIGGGWEWLTPAVKRALVAERAFAIVRSQARETVAVDAMDQLLADMLQEAGLESE